MDSQRPWVDSIIVIVTPTWIRSGVNIYKRDFNVEVRFWLAVVPSISRMDTRISASAVVDIMRTKDEEKSERKNRRLGKIIDTSPVIDLEELEATIASSRPISILTPVDIIKFGRVDGGGNGHIITFRADVLELQRDVDQLKSIDVYFLLMDPIMGDALAKIMVPTSPPIVAPLVVKGQREST
ncbi:hypothetical protein HAX54_007960 [Datura stramonium]|uniref:Uncharacterized protein n=1 Tax=Datura stramonium TaxID=4076 RepID=A0ABS8RVQ5_DATST|nr:hypothetical protein [Datura stramonium]